jgi:hypothetical protein
MIWNFLFSIAILVLGFFLSVAISEASTFAHVDDYHEGTCGCGGSCKSAGAPVVLSSASQSLAFDSLSDQSAKYSSCGCSSGPSLPNSRTGCSCRHNEPAIVPFD